MGRELQKKKNRSSTPKIRQKPKSKKLNNPRANAIIAANWDKTLSVAQNYRNLGLTSKLNHRTGGIERQQKYFGDEDEGPLAGENDPLAIIGSKKASKIEIDEVSVLRDPETGNILEVVGEDALLGRAVANPLNDPLNDLEDEYDQKLVAGAQQPSKKRTVRELEDLAARGEEKRPRKQSQREKDWAERLVKKHGDNYKAMSRDMKLNPMQQSEGDIKVRVHQWRKSQTPVEGQKAFSKEDEMDKDVDKLDTSHHHEGSVQDGTKPSCACKKSLEDFEATLPEHMRVKI